MYCRALSSRLDGMTVSRCSNIRRSMAASTRSLFRARSRCRRPGFYFALRASAANSLPIGAMNRVAGRSGVRAAFGMLSSALMKPRHTCVLCRARHKAHSLEIMCPTSEVHELVIVCDAVVQLITVGHQHSAWLHTRIEPLGVLRASPRRVRQLRTGSPESFGCTQR